MARIVCFVATFMVLVGCGADKTSVAIPPPACDALETRLRVVDASPERIDLE